MTVRLTVWLALPALVMSIVQAAAAQESRPVSVLELFTSQGCSSCPAADALFARYAMRSDIVALSFPVDYWDYLGWKDTLASSKFTSRQRAYADVRGDGRVYTPQVVVNGMVHVVGSHEEEIDAAIAKTARKQPVRIGVHAQSDGSMLTIETEPGPGDAALPGGTIWLAVVQPAVEVEISRGENRGKRVTYTNVVREFTAVGMWSAKPVRIELQQSAVIQKSGQRCAVLLQEGTVGRIVGATWVIGPTN
jgi:hypothetical protein